MLKEGKDSSNRINLMANAGDPYDSRARNCIEIYVPIPDSLPAVYEINNSKGAYACFTNFVLNRYPEEIISYDNNVHGLIIVIQYNSDSIECSFRFSGQLRDSSFYVDITNGLIVYHFKKQI